MQILRALRLADEWKVRAVLYGGQQGYAVADALAAGKIPVLVSLKWPERPKDADPEVNKRCGSCDFAIARRGLRRHWQRLG